MNLKPIVASLTAACALGLASSPVFAHAQSTDTRAQLAAMSAQVAKMEAVLDQNQGGVQIFLLASHSWRWPVPAMPVFCASHGFHSMPLHIHSFAMYVQRRLQRRTRGLTL